MGILGELAIDILIDGGYSRVFNMFLISMFINISHKTQIGVTLCFYYNRLLIDDKE
jgi:hypothetical protein